MYYVCEGEPNAPGHAHPTCGHMIFRCGARPHEEGGPRLGPTGVPRTGYFAVPPTPGTLWLFPGGAPHCVLPFHGEGVRVSCAVNFEEAVC